MGFSSFPVNCPLNQSIEPKKATRVKNCWACWACWLWLFGTIESKQNGRDTEDRGLWGYDMIWPDSPAIDYDYIWRLANRWGQMAHQSQTNFGIILCPITLQPMTGARSIRLLPRGEIARGRQKEWTWRPWNQDQEHECEPKTRYVLQYSLFGGFNPYHAFVWRCCFSLQCRGCKSNHQWVLGCPAMPDEFQAQGHEATIGVHQRSYTAYPLYSAMKMYVVHFGHLHVHILYTHIYYIYTIHIQISIYLSVCLSIYLSMDLILMIYLSTYLLSIYLEWYRYTNI